MPQSAIEDALARWRVGHVAVPARAPMLYESVDAMRAAFASTAGGVSLGDGEKFIDSATTRTFVANEHIVVASR